MIRDGVRRQSLTIMERTEMKMREQYQTHPRDAFKLDIHDLAKKMIADGYYGQNTFEPEKTEDAILVAAHDPTIMDWLPERVYAFWEVLDYRYRVWKARRDFKRPYKNANGDPAVDKNFPI